MKKIFQHKIFNIFDTRKLEGVIFKGLIMFLVSVFFFYNYSESKDGMKFIMGIVTAILALFTIDDYLNLKKNKPIN